MIPSFLFGGETMSVTAFNRKRRELAKKKADEAAKREEQEKAKPKQRKKTSKKEV